MQKLQPLLPYAIGVLIAGIIYIFPDAKPIACGLGAVLPFSVAST